MERKDYHIFSEKIDCLTSGYFPLGKHVVKFKWDQFHAKNTNLWAHA